MKSSSLRIGLRTKTFFGLVIPISILFVILTYTNASYPTGRLKRDHSSGIDLVVNATEDMLRHHTVAEVIEDPDKFLKLWSGNNGGLDGAAVYQFSPRGKTVLAASTVRGEDAKKMAAVTAATLKTGARTQRERAGHLWIAAPFKFKDGKSGIVSTVIDLTARDKLIDSLSARSVQIFGLGLLVLSAIIFAGLEHSFMGPVRRLRQATMRVEKGRFKPPATMSHRDEMGDLTRAISDMTARLDGHARALERRLSELTVLHNISKITGASLDLDATLQTILESAVEVTAASSGFIMLPGSGELSKSLELKASHGVPVGEVGSAIVSREIADHVAQSGSPLLLRGEARQSEFADRAKFKDAVYAPINLGESGVGVIGLVNRRRRNFSTKELELLSTLANQAASVINAARLFSDLQESYFNTVQALAAAIDAKDPYTRGHAARVAGYSEVIAGHLGCSEDQLKAIKIAAYLHDVGKIGIEEHILTKPQDLTEQEYRIVRDHPNISARILAGVSFLKETVPMVRHHHEHFDGHGYPDGLVGEDIPLGARVISVADAFDAMASDRPYRKGLDHKEALAELQRQAGAQFDPRIVEIFTEHFQEAPSFTHSADEFMPSTLL